MQRLDSEQLGGSLWGEVGGCCRGVDEELIS